MPKDTDTPTTDPNTRDESSLSGMPCSDGFLQGPNGPRLNWDLYETNLVNHKKRVEAIRQSQLQTRHWASRAAREIGALDYLNAKEALIWLINQRPNS